METDPTGRKKPTMPLPLPPVCRVNSRRARRVRCFLATIRPGTRSATYFKSRTFRCARDKVGAPVPPRNGAMTDAQPAGRAWGAVARRRQARGMQRTYCFVFLMADRIYLVNSWPFLVAYVQRGAAREIAKAAALTASSPIMPGTDSLRRTWAMLRGGGWRRQHLPSHCHGCAASRRPDL